MNMILRDRLLQRLEMKDINEIISSAQKNENIRTELYKLAFDSEDKLSVNALWIMAHYSATTNEWLYDKQNELMDKSFDQPCLKAAFKTYRMDYPDYIFRKTCLREIEFR